MAHKWHTEISSQPIRSFCSHICIFSKSNRKRENLKCAGQSNAHHWQSHRINIKHKYDSNFILFDFMTDHQPKEQLTIITGIPGKIPFPTALSFHFFDAFFPRFLPVHCLRDWHFINMSYLIEYSELPRKRQRERVSERSHHREKGVLHVLGRSHLLSPGPLSTLIDSHELKRSFSRVYFLRFFWLKKIHIWGEGNIFLREKLNEKISCFPRSL